MRKLIIFATLLLSVASCKKELAINKDENGLMDRVTAYLKDSLGKEEWQALDFSKVIRTTGENSPVYVRIPFKGQEIKNAFILLQMEEKVLQGRKVYLTRLADAEAAPYTFNGNITIRYLNNELLLQSGIEKGFITAWHAEVPKTELVQPDHYSTMPEVVVVASMSKDYGFTTSDWVSLQSLFGGYTGGGSSSYYSSLDGSGAYAGGGGSYSNSGYGSKSGMYVYSEAPLLVDVENGQKGTAIDVQKFINCFNNIPDVGANCSIEIFADIPVDTDPNKIFDFNSGSPGHTFFQLRKTNGSQSVIQNIGFYPQLGWKSIVTNAPIAGKFVDNGGHEYNASFKMALSAENFKSTLMEILYLANFIKYDLDNYNCTDFALDVFNKTRPQKLDIPLIHIPGNFPATGSRTPQGLYQKLNAMKSSGHPEASNITTGIYKGWVANSNGPCN